MVYEDGFYPIVKFSEEEDVGGLPKGVEFFTLVFVEGRMDLEHCCGSCFLGAFEVTFSEVGDEGGHGRGGFGFFKWSGKGIGSGQGGQGGKRVIGERRGDVRDVLGGGGGREYFCEVLAGHWNFGSES